MVGMPDEARAAYAQLMAGLVAEDNPGIRVTYTVDAVNPDDPPHKASAVHRPPTSEKEATS